MVIARLVCTDPDCRARWEAWGALIEIDTLSCTCSAALAVLGWPDEPAAGAQAVEACLLEAA